MFEVIVPDREEYDDENGFVLIKGGRFTVEHSLLSISKWESKWKTPFIGIAEKTPEQTLDYIKCMTLDKNVDPEIYTKLTEANLRGIDSYIHDPMTATTFSELQEKKAGFGRGRVVTSELIYYYMTAYQIPVEFEKWHINRLMTLIKICSIENEPPKKMSKSDLAKRNSALNAARRAKYHTRG